MIPESTDLTGVKHGQDHHVYINSRLGNMDSNVEDSHNPLLGG